MATTMKRWLRSELPLLVVVVYLPRIQILVGQSWVGTTLKGWPFGLSGRGSSASAAPGIREKIIAQPHVASLAPYQEELAVARAENNPIRQSCCQASWFLQLQMTQLPRALKEHVLMRNIITNPVTHLWLVMALFHGSTLQWFLGNCKALSSNDIEHADLFGDEDCAFKPKD
jgi:hypothetical protein